MNQLEEAREKIDQIDAQLACLFEQRMQAVQGVIAYKKQTGMAILDSGREEQVIEKNTARIQQQDLQPYYQQWQRDLMKISRQYQAKILGQDIVGYQGVEGAFAHIALQKLFPYAKAKNYSTWREVFEAVEQGEVAFGVLPFENSTTGRGAGLVLWTSLPCGAGVRFASGTKPFRFAGGRYFIHQNCL